MAKNYVEWKDQAAVPDVKIVCQLFFNEMSFPCVTQACFGMVSRKLKTEGLPKALLTFSVIFHSFVTDVYGLES